MEEFIENESGKIVELPDSEGDSSDDEMFEDCTEGEDEGFLHFKKSFLENRSVFEKQLLDSVEIDPTKLFEMPSVQQNEGDEQTMHLKLEQQVVEAPYDDQHNGSRIQFLTSSMAELQDTGIFKKIQVKGVGLCPPKDAIVTIHYNAYVEDEASCEIKSFDSTVLRGKPQTFVRGQGHVILGLDVAVGSMKKSEQSEIVIPPDYAFGQFGCPPRIPASAFVLFRVELLDWVDSCAAEAFSRLPASMRKLQPFEKVIEAARSEKTKGSSFVAKKDYKSAKMSYKRALYWMDDCGYPDEACEAIGEKLKLQLNLDLALVYLKLNVPKKTCIHCQQVLRVDRDNAKAHYRYGLAQDKLGDHHRAMSSLLTAKRICPLDPSINRSIMEINSKVQKETYVEKDLCKRMMGLNTTTRRDDVANVPVEFQELIVAQLTDFVADGRQKQLAMPQSMSESERRFVNSQARRLGLDVALRTSVNGQGICTIIKRTM